MPKGKANALPLGYVQRCLFRQDLIDRRALALGRHPQAQHGGNGGGDVGLADDAVGRCV